MSWLCGREFKTRTGTPVDANRRTLRQHRGGVAMRMRRNNWGAYASLLGLTGGCLLAACSDQAADDAGELSTHTDGVIIGTNDLVKVQAGGSNLPAKYQSFVNAFGRLHMAGGLCTATHLGNGI